MPDITFPRSSAPGTRPQESGGRLINAFTEKTLQGAPSDTIIRRSPGLERIAVAPISTAIHTRGFLDITTEAIWILDEIVFKMNKALELTQLGILSGKLPVTTARNNAFPDKQNVVVTELGCFNLNVNSPPSAFADADLPLNPTSVCDIDGYFVWSYADGRVFASDLNSVNVSALSFNTEQGLNVRRVVRHAGRLYAFGDKWTGVYRNVGSIPFPFAREVTIPRGIVGTHAIAGWEAGWANQLVWVGDDFIVYRLDGYTPVAVSTNDVSRAVQEAVLAGDRDVLEAFVYMYEKNAFWVLNAHERFTWEYNLTTGEWNERQSFNKNNWKGMRSLRIFDRWLIGDEYTGDLWQINGTNFREGGDPLIWQVESGVVSGFPLGMIIPKSSFHLTSGVGNFKTVPEPRVEISWSLNGGASYGQPVLRRLGAPGHFNSHPSVLSSGLSRGQGVRYRLRVSDAVHVGLSGGVIDPEPRAWAG
jgi:hypothetical protein